MRTIVVLIFLLLSIEQRGQHISFKQISTRDGLPSNTLYRTFQDSKGFFWYLSDKGISRSDGVNWVTFSSKDGLEDLAAFHIVESGGVLWFVTTRLSLYCFTGNRFVRILTDKEVTWIESDDEGVIAMTRLGDIYRIKSFSFQSKTIVSNPRRPHSYTFTRGKNNQFIIGGNERIDLVDSIRTIKPIVENSTFKRFIFPRVFYKSDTIRIIANHEAVYEFNVYSHQKELLFRLERNELMSYLFDSISGIEFFGMQKGLYCKRQAQNSIWNTYMKDLTISSIVKSGMGNYYVSTFGSGVFRFRFDVVHLDKEEGIQNVLFSNQNRHGVYFFSANGKYWKIRNTDFKILERAQLRLGATDHISNVMHLDDSTLVLGTNDTYILRDTKLTKVELPNGKRGHYWIDNNDKYA